MAADLITASLATIPERRHTLREVVQRILPQVDHLNVYCNETPGIPEGSGYPHFPAFLQHPKITAVWSRDTDFGDRGDAGKFYWADEVSGIHFTLDDDGLYPPNFVEHLVGRLLAYDRKVVVGLMGVLFREPITSYYHCRQKFPAPKPLEKDIPVQLLGTGSVCYHTDTLRVSREDFRLPNMGDVWFAILGQQQQVPFVCVQRPANWMSQDLSVAKQSIWMSSRRRDGSQKDVGRQKTKAAKAQAPWRIFHPEGK